MKLAFINPPGPRYLYRGTICTYISKARYVWKPKDFILLSSIVPPEWDIVFLDAAIDGLSLESTFQWIERESPDAMVIALSSIVWRDDLNFLKRLREKFQNKKIIVFGEVFLEFPYAKIAMQYADNIIYDSLRSNFLELLETDSKTFSPYQSGKKELKEVKTYIPRHVLFDNIKYRWPFVKHFKFASVYTQFGCPLACTYCTESITNVTCRPAENVIEEMIDLKKKGYRELQIGDASFGYPRDNAIRILEGMIRENLRFVWSSYTYPGFVDSKMMELMAMSGCHTLVIGVDSVDESLLKKYGRNLSLNKIRDFIANCHKSKIDVCGDFVIGFKEDTKESCLRTIELSLQLDLDYASFNIATPLMGSSIRKDYEERNLIQQGSMGYDTAGLNEVFDFGSLKARELIWLRNYAVKRFYLRPSYIWKRLRKNTSIEELLIKANEAYGVVYNVFKQKRALRDGYL